MTKSLVIFKQNTAHALLRMDFCCQSSLLQTGPLTVRLLGNWTLRAEIEVEKVSVVEGVKQDDLDKKVIRFLTAWDFMFSLNAAMPGYSRFNVSVTT